MIEVTVVAPINIAVIKYWGKRDVSLNLPLNSSLSVTLSPDVLFTKTTILANPSFKNNTFILNENETLIDSDPILSNLLILFKNRAQSFIKDNQILVTKDDLIKYKIQIHSHNNFPMSSGLASSASGNAALVLALSTLYSFQENFTGELSCITRQCSGSACRSLYGGFVLWEKGEHHEGTDSISRCLYPSDYWPELCAIILVVSQNPKEVSSRMGMQHSVQTSPLLASRISLVDDRIRLIQQAISQNNFPQFAQITMQDSNNFHAICLDSYPPLHYLNDISFHIIDTISKLNQPNIKAAYTFDAGANAIIFTLKSCLSEVLQTLCFSLSSIASSFSSHGLFSDPLQLYSGNTLDIPPCVQKIFLTNVGGSSSVVECHYHQDPSVRPLSIDHFLPKINFEKMVLLCCAFSLNGQYVSIGNQYSGPFYLSSTASYKIHFILMVNPSLLMKKDIIIDHISISSSPQLFPPYSLNFTSSLNIDIPSITVLKHLHHSFKLELTFHYSLSDYPDLFFDSLYEHLFTLEVDSKNISSKESSLICFDFVTNTQILSLPSWVDKSKIRENMISLLI